MGERRHATIFAPLSSISPRDFDATQVTYLGQVHGTMAALARMRTRNRGAIVNVGSALASRAIPLQSAYCGAKFAVRGFTDAVRSELIHDGLDVHLSLVDLIDGQPARARRARQPACARAGRDRRAWPLRP
ncbi:SDR family NAD(P)-dependent oxidoreductase [Paraburkholderia sp. CNPSo 3076]|uniref:SDR family NAD(P)-dependent oxidoreductase n=1 Tax=Paraburkholderia sp. CNPSo 3076 TaxID=2940936 RepID=UPI003A520F26